MEQQQELKGEGVSFERIRRITGYLVGNLDRFNTAKRAEVEDRLKHTIVPFGREKDENRQLGRRDI